MITFLFGAGASNGSDKSGIPPLGNALFDKLKVFATDTWGMVAGSNATKFEANLESYTS